MKQTVNNDEYSSFLERFYGFNDTVIRSIRLAFNDNGTQRLELRISAQDSTIKDADKWVCVTVIVEGISEILIHEQVQTTIQVISHGLHILTLDDMFGLEFGGATDAPNSLLNIRESDAFVVGKKLLFNVSSY